jgi:hypothetical protein
LCWTVCDAGFGWRLHQPWRHSVHDIANDHEGPTR